METLDTPEKTWNPATQWNPLPDFSTWTPGLLKANLVIWQSNRFRAEEAIRRIQEILQLDDSMMWTVHCSTGETLFWADDLADAQCWLKEEGQHGDYIDADEKPE